MNAHAVLDIKAAWLAEKDKSSQNQDTGPLVTFKNSIIFTFDDSQVPVLKSKTELLGFRTWLRKSNGFIVEHSKTGDVNGGPWKRDYLKALMHLFKVKKK